MSISHYHNLQRKLQAFEIHILPSTSLTNIAETNIVVSINYLLLKLLNLAKSGFGGYKDCANYYFA